MEYLSNPELLGKGSCFISLQLPSRKYRKNGFFVFQEGIWKLKPQLELEGHCLGV